MRDNVNIRSRVKLGVTGDWAVVHRIMEIGDQIYVEVDQTSDAREPTIMVAVDEALSKYEAEQSE